MKFESESFAHWLQNGDTRNVRLRVMDQAGEAQSWAAQDCLQTPGRQHEAHRQFHPCSYCFVIHSWVRKKLLFIFLFLNISCWKILQKVKGDEMWLEASLVIILFSTVFQILAPCFFILTIPHLSLPLVTLLPGCKCFIYIYMAQPWHETSETPVCVLIK